MSGKISSNQPAIQTKSTNAGNTQRARVISCSCQTNGTAFYSVCKFEVVGEVRLRFNSQGHSSPVCVTLHDIVYRNGTIRLENEMVARVNALTFRQISGSPKMEITLASVKPENADDSLWQNCVGKIRGVVANFLVPPLSVPADGHQTMMEFGLALAMEKPSFTFPIATRLKNIPGSPLAAK